MTAPAEFPLAEAVTRFLTFNSKKKAVESQQELQKFLRWNGRERPLQELTPHHIEAYCEMRVSASTTQLAPLKAFLAFIHAEGLCDSNLASHVRAKKTLKRTKAALAAKSATPNLSLMTREGHTHAVAEVEELKSQRLGIADEIRTAMADKDFRENAPLDAARDKQAHLESRIREIEITLENAHITDETQPQKGKVTRAQVGCRVIVRDIALDEEITYQLVHTSEVNPALGKISGESPTGKAFLGRTAGQTVKVQAPVGTVQYRIERVEF